MVVSMAMPMTQRPETKSDWPTFFRNSLAALCNLLGDDFQTALGSHVVVFFHVVCILMIKDELLGSMK